MSDYRRSALQSIVERMREVRCICRQSRASPFRVCPSLPASGKQSPKQRRQFDSPLGQLNRKHKIRTGLRTEPVPFMVSFPVLCLAVLGERARSCAGAKTMQSDQVPRRNRNSTAGKEGSKEDRTGLLGRPLWINCRPLENSVDRFAALTSPRPLPKLDFGHFQSFPLTSHE